MLLFPAMGFGRLVSCAQDDTHVGGGYRDKPRQARYALPDQEAAILRNTLFLWIVYLALVANIAVALIPDVDARNYYNAFAGLLLGILVPLPTDGWRIGTSRHSHHDLLVDSADRLVPALCVVVDEPRL